MTQQAEKVIAFPKRAEKDREPSAVPDDEAEAKAWFEDLMKAYGNKVAGYYRYKLRDDDLSSDLTIECFARVWKARHSFRGEAKASTWLWTIARRTLAAHFEKKKRRSPEVLTDEIPERSAAESPDPADRSQKRRALTECLEALNEKIQRCAELVWVLGHSYVEVAEMLGESPDTVRMRLKRARKPLQECLVSKGIVGA